MKGYHSHRIYSNPIWKGKFDLVCDEASCVAFDRSGNFAAVAVMSPDCQVELWDVRSNAVAMCRVDFPEECRGDGAMWIHHLRWSPDNNRVCIVMSRSSMSKHTSVQAMQNQNVFYLITWSVFTREVLSSWKFPIALTSLDFVGDSDELLLMSRYGKQGHYVFNVVSGQLRELDMSMLQQGEAARLDEMWGKVVKLPASRGTTPGGTAGETAGTVPDSVNDGSASSCIGDVQVAGRAKPGGDQQSVPSTSAVSTVRVGHRGGDLAVVLNDQVGNARSVVLVEIELGRSAPGERDDLTALRVAAIGGAPSGCAGPVTHLDVSRAQSQKRLLVGWAHSTVAIYDLPDLHLRWHEVAEGLHGVAPPEILAAGYVARYKERRPQHLDPAMDGSELGQNQQELDAFVIICANDQWASGAAINRHSWAGKAIFCHERDGIDMAGRLSWASLNNDRVSFSGAWVCPSAHKLLFMGVGYMRQGPRAPGAKHLGVSSGTSSGTIHMQKLSLHAYTQVNLSDFPGPMYPMGFSLKEDCTVYTEAEDELDKVVRNRRDGKATVEDEGATVAAGEDSALLSGRTGTYNGISLMDPSVSLEVGSSFGTVGVGVTVDAGGIRGGRKTRLPMCTRQFDLNQEHDSHARSSGKQGKVRLLLSRPCPKEAAVLAYSQKTAQGGVYDENQSAIGASSSISVGLIGSAFDGSTLGSRAHGNAPPQPFTAFLRPPRKVATGELRTKVLGPASAGAIQMAKCHSDPTVAAERVAAMQKEAVDELRKDLVKRHRSLQVKLEKDRQRQLKLQEEQMKVQHTREMQKLRKEQELALVTSEAQVAADKGFTCEAALGAPVSLVGAGLSDLLAPPEPAKKAPRID